MLYYTLAPGQQCAHNGKNLEPGEVIELPLHVGNELKGKLDPCTAEGLSLAGLEPAALSLAQAAPHERAGMLESMTEEKRAEMEAALSAKIAESKDIKRGTAEDAIAGAFDKKKADAKSEAKGAASQKLADARKQPDNTLPTPEPDGGSSETPTGGQATTGLEEQPGQIAGPDTGAAVAVPTTPPKK